MRRAHRSLWFAGAVLLGGCGGGGIASTTPQPAAPLAGAGGAVLQLTIPARGAATDARTARYISPSTQSVGVSVNSGAAQLTNVGPNLPGCTGGTGGTTCTISVTAAPGNDTFTVNLFDQPGGAGNLLSTAQATGTVSAGQTFTINANALGVAKTVQLVLGQTSAAGQVQVSARALDAGGNPIAGTFSTPVTVGASGSLAVTLSGTSLASSTSSVTASYAASAAQSATITVTLGSASATGALPLTTATTYPLPSAQSMPFLMAAGPDGNVWIGESGPVQYVSPFTGYVAGTAAKVAKFNLATGAITEFPLPSANNTVAGIASGPDGNLYFGEAAAAIGRITPAGQITEFAVPAAAGKLAFSVRVRTPVVGPDGAIWFAESGGNSVGRMTTSGQFTEFPLGRSASGTRIQPIGISFGPDGQIWGAATGANLIFRMTTSGAVTQFAAAPNAGPRFVVTGSDGALWYTQIGPQLSGATYGDLTQPRNAITRLTTGGVATAFSVPYSLLEPDPIVSGPDGALWVGDIGGGYIGRLTTGGTYDLLPAAFGASINGLCFAPDGSLVYGDDGNNTVGRVVFGPGWAPLPASLSISVGTPIVPALLGIAESGNAGPYTVTAADATVTVAPVPGSTKTWSVLGTQPGTTSIAVADPRGRVAIVPVAVSATTVNTLAKRRKSEPPGALP